MILSILIPSKNNPSYLESAAKGFIALGEELTVNSELVLVDNSSTENINLKNLNYDGIVYKWDPKPLDMLGNFNRAVQSAKGKYLSILGDDDFILPSIFEVAKLLDRESIDTAMAELAPYYWPNVNTYWNKNNADGVLEIPKTKVSHSFYDVKNGLDLLLKLGGSQYINILPSAYHGLVRTSVMLQLINKYGTAFPGPSPDISNAVLLSLHNVSCYKVQPFIISGAAIGSAAAEGASHAHHGELDKRASFIKRGNVSWPTNVPQFFCGPTMWAVSVIHTLKTTNNEDIIERLDSNMLHAACLAYHPQYYNKLLISFLSQQKYSFLKLFIGFSSIIIQRIVQFMRNWIRYNKSLNFLSNWKIVTNVSDTSEVGKYVRK